MSEDNHKAFAVEIVNEQGVCVGTKPYGEVDRLHDILKNVFIFLLTPDRELILATITEHRLSKKIYKGKFGTPTVSLLRHGEDCEKAAKRALVNDLAIYPATLVHLGDNMETMNDGTRRLMCVYYAIHDTNVKVNGHILKDIRPVRREELTRLLQTSSEQFSPQFLVAYDRYKSILPF
ncbi:MAG: hypothetical protein A2542_00530 [Parcubacteria group bacterium RIFOXYD2_FULL_52_8]|nr:MAG: hypothetical protein A2542_00530 [Parcubacteria group bacterium RIFOXYD2_FULL_52_8]